MNPLSRRHFLRTAATAGTVAWTARSWAQVTGSNSDARVAVVGIKGRGESHIDGFSRLSGCRVVAFCDVDTAVLSGGVAKYAKEGPNRKALQVDGVSDVRRLLERKDIDIVAIATPNHWHSLGAIWAIQAGKDVYLEKPVSHNVSEGRRVVEFARKHKRIVQTGTQSRSSRAGIQEAVDWVRAGNIGKIKVARGLCYKRRDSIGKVDGPQPIPEGIDYDLWCGPAEKVPLMRKRLHYDWHWVWNTGNGDLGNQGIHQMDICRWFLGEDALAPRVLSVGGRIGYVDDGETPNTQIVYQDYAKAPLVFEVRGLPDKKAGGKMDNLKGASVGCIIECENGHVVVPSYSSSVAYDKDGKKLKEWKGGGDHFANFFKAVQSRRPEDLHADILEGHLSSALCHTGNISHLLGARKSPDEIREAIKADRGMSESWGRMLEHIKANELDPAREPIAMGVPLRMDPKTERFLDNDAANALLTRSYRPGYVVPAKA